MSPVVEAWNAIGLGLRLHPGIIDGIDHDYSSSSSWEHMKAVVLAWLMREYNVERFGEPTWRILVHVVAHPAAGNNPAHALKIAREHSGSCTYTIVVLDDYNVLSPVSVYLVFKPVTYLCTISCIVEELLNIHLTILKAFVLVLYVDKHSWLW